MHDPVIIGKIGRTIGLKGDLLFYSYSEIPVQKFYIEKPDWQPISLTIKQGIRPTVKIAGVNSRELACRYTNKQIAISRADMPELAADEFYWHDLIGLQVINKQQTILGIISEIQDNGAQPNLVVINNTNTQIIPLIPQVVYKKDFLNKKIYVDWDYI